MPDRPGGPLVPEDFLLGVATSGFQIEGGFNGPGEPANNWVALGAQRAGGALRGGLRLLAASPSRPSTGRPGMGCNAFRLSVEWARLEPDEGEFDARALDRYVEILGMCVERGMAPVVTLHHFTHPWWLGEEFWLTPGSPDRFAGPRGPGGAGAWRRTAAHWVTVNEPNIVALMGWIEGACPPGRRGAAADAWAVADNLLTAHVLAYQAIHERPARRRW